MVIVEGIDHNLTFTLRRSHSQMIRERDPTRHFHLLLKNLQSLGMLVLPVPDLGGGDNPVCCGISGSLFPLLRH